MASVVLSEAEKLYIVHGVQVPRAAGSGLGWGGGRKEGGREASTVVYVASLWSSDGQSTPSIGTGSSRLRAGRGFVFTE